MGRRERLKRRRNEKALNVSCSPVLVSLCRWLAALGWTGTQPLCPAVFAATGRGLQAKANIAAGSVLISLPQPALINATTVRQSRLGKQIESLYGRVPHNLNAQPQDKRNGYNHPHNMLHCLHVMPNSVRGRNLRSLLAYLYLQMTLGVSDLDLPNYVSMTDVQEMMIGQMGLWRALHGHHYAMRCVVGFLDAIFSGDASDIPHNSNNFEAVRFVNSHLSEYGKRLPSMDPLNLDPVVVKEITCELSNRWTLALQNSQSVFSLKEQRTAYMAKGYE